VVFVSSKVTTAWRLSKFTIVWLTPGTCDKPLLTVMGHTAQSIPGIDKVTVIGAALTARGIPENRTLAPMEISSRLICDDIKTGIEVSFQ